MSKYIIDEYEVSFWNERVGDYYLYDDHTVSFYLSYQCNEDTKKELRKYGLDKGKNDVKSIMVFDDIIQPDNRVKGRKRIIYQKDDFMLERRPKPSGERYSVYRRSAKEGDPDYSPLEHDAPHYEGPHTPEGMREWASWYAFNKMDDGTYEAELDEAWCWGGSHNDGGTMHRELPEELFELPYNEFLEEVVSYAAAEHYGFTAEMLKEKEGLKEFFGFTADED